MNDETKVKNKLKVILSVRLPFRGNENRIKKKKKIIIL